MGQVLRATKGRPGRGVARNGLWSALQTRLQGVDGATLPVIPEIEILHVTLLSLWANAYWIASSAFSRNYTLRPAVLRRLARCY